MRHGVVIPSILLLVLAGCASTRGAAGDPPRVQPIPAALTPAIDRAERIGRLLYAYDVVSARATDVLMVDAKVDLEAAGTLGWITFQRDERFVVQFVKKLPDGTLAATHEIVFAKDRPVEEDVDSFEPARKLTSDVAAMFQARVTALEEMTRTNAFCGTGPNPVVLPAAVIGSEGWLVYVIAGSTRPNEVMLSGHRLYRASADGLRILEEIPLSKTCLRQDVTPAEGSTAAGSVLNHVVSPAPTEAHVFVSLLYRILLGVLTREGMWIVNEGKVAYYGQPNANR